jgi:hypothetical protein
MTTIFDQLHRISFVLNACGDTPNRKLAAVFVLLGGIQSGW